MRTRNATFRLWVIIFSLATGAPGCLFSKTNSGDQNVFARTASSIDPAVWTACNDKLSDDIVKPGAVIVPYTINSIMKDPVTGAIVCTPRGMREKIKRAFDLYASIPEANIAFRYAGEDPLDYSLSGGNDVMNPPPDGNLHVILTDDSTGYSGIAGSTWYWGMPHNGSNNPTATTYTTYPGGYLSLVLHDTAGHQNPGALSFGLILHEMGHALGLDHIPAKGANMSRYSAYGPGEFYAFTEQERANIAAVMPAPGKTIYQISGSVVTSLSGSYNGTASSVVNGIADVYAVDITNGRTYSGLGHVQGANNPLRFWINILHPGSYRLVVIPDGYPNLGFDPSSMLASWYIDNSTSTNDPLAGTVITLNDSTPTATGLTLNMLSGPSAYYLNAAYAQSDPVYSHSSSGEQIPLQFDPNYMYAGDSGTFQFWVVCQSTLGGNSPVANCDPVTALEPYGTSPDYSFSDLAVTDSAGTPPNSITFYSARVSVGSNPAPGHRLVIGRAANGKVQVAVMGTHILNGPTRPTLFNRFYSISQQFQGYLDFSILSPYWWR